MHAYKKLECSFCISFLHKLNIIIFVYFQGVNNGTVYAIPTSQAYAVRGQLSPASAVVLSPGSGLQSSPIGSEDATRKREMRLLKNRFALYMYIH
jgi:hypothetical protein